MCCIQSKHTLKSSPQNYYDFCTTLNPAEAFDFIVVNIVKPMSCIFQCVSDFVIKLLCLVNYSIDLFSTFLLHHLETLCTPQNLLILISH